MSKANSDRPMRKANRPPLTKEQKDNLYDRGRNLINAVQHGNIGEVENLLSADPNFTGQYAISMDGKTALMIAIENGNKDIANILIQWDRKSVNATNHIGMTALMIATESSSLWHEITDIPKLLLDNGAEVNAKNIHGETPLILALKKLTHIPWPDIEPLVRLLLDRGAKLDEEDRESLKRYLREDVWDLINKNISATGSGAGGGAGSGAGGGDNETQQNLYMKSLYVSS